MCVCVCVCVCMVSGHTHTYPSYTMSYSPENVTNSDSKHDVPDDVTVMSSLCTQLERWRRKHKRVLLAGGEELKGSLRSRDGLRKGCCWGALWEILLYCWENKRRRRKIKTLCPPVSFCVWTFCLQTEEPSHAELKFNKHSDFKQNKSTSCPTGRHMGQT